MPIIRYQIRNEYGLADPELYGAADKEDPEALLEGVAMAGLVGVLRQLGDLAEFAAEIFHSLHEEVMATAARGHALMLRVQQLEVDFPAIERVFLSQTSHSQLSYNAAIDWHPNLQIDQNLITREDMPRFILDSYEESRGPPRLFMLDKFDIAGDGACLKRYSDPSFFKMDFAASGKMEPDVQREKKSRKNKKKVPRWRNGETPESHITSHANSRLEHVATEKAPENPPVKRAKLKTRQLNDNTSIRRSYMEQVVRGLSSEHMDLSENSISHSCIKTKTVNSTEVAPDVREVIMDTSIDRSFFRERNRTKLYNKGEVILAQKEETVSDLKDGQNEKGLLQKASSEVERLPPTFNKAGQKELFDADCKREANDGAESRTSGSLDGYRSNDAASELDNYLDALTTMDSEIETDNETKGKLAPSFFSKEHSKVGSNIDEERGLLDECLGSHKSRQSSQNSLSNKRISSPPNEDSLNSLADSTPSDGTSSALPGMFIDPETPADEARNINFQNKANSELLQKDASIDLITLDESRIESTSSCIADTTAAETSLDASPEDKPSATANQSTSPSHSDVTEKSSICFDGEYNPPVNSDDLSAMEGTNVMLSNLVDGHEEVDKLLEEDFHPIKIPSTTENDYANPGLISKNNEIFSDTLLQSWDESDSNLQVQDDPSLETQMALLCAEEPSVDSAEVIISMPSVSDPPQIIKATDLEFPSSICIEDSSLPFKEEDLHRSVCQGPEVDPGESTLPGKCAPIFPLDNSSSSFVPDDSLGPVDNSVMSDEKFECARSLTSHEDGADSAEDEVTSAQNTGDFAEMEVTASGTSLPEPSIDNKVPQESCNLDQVEFILKGEMVPQEFCNLDQVKFTQNGELVLQESLNLDEVEFTQKGELPNNLKVLPNVSNCETKDSFLANETRDSPSSTEDCLNLLIGKIPFSSPVDLLPAEGSSPHSVIEFTETNELFPATMHSKESSSNNTNLQEYSFSSDSILEQQKLEVTEAACPKDLIGLDLQQVPGTVASQKEYIVVTGPQDSVTAGHILDSSSQPDSGEHNHVCYTEPCELAQEDLYPSDGNRDTIPSVEVEGGKSLSPILQNESNSISSDLEHYLGKVEASNSENLTGGDDHQASKIAFPGQEESDAVNDPGDSKTGESIPDSFDHMDMAPAPSVPCQEDQKMVVSPQNSRTEERLLESSDTFAIESVKHAEVNIDEVIEYPLKSQQLSHSKPLASREPCMAVNGDVFLSDDIIAESISPSKGLSTIQSSDEPDEHSLLQKIETLNLSNTHFEREQSCQQDDNSRKTKCQPSVPEAAQDSIEAVSRGYVYELDVTSANVASSIQLKTEVDSPLQSSYGSPVSSANSSTSLASLQAFPSFGTFSTPMVQQQSSELPLDRDPPLPPLPPLQWRMGKLRPSSAFTNEEMTRPEIGLNNLTTLPSMDHSGGSLVMGGGEVQLSNPFSQVQLYPDDSGQFGYQTLEKDRLNPFQLNAPPSAMEDKKCQDDMLALDEQMKHLHVKDDQQKNEFCREDLSEVPQSLNPFTSSLELSDVRSEHFQRVSDGESIEPPNSSASQPTIVHTQPLHGNAGLENATTNPFNPFLSLTCSEGEHYRYDYGAFGSEMAHLNRPDPSSTTEIAPQGFPISQWGNMQTFESVTLPMAEHEKPNGRPRSLLNRPRDPLIEAVASHDKSTLRRVSELVRPSAKPEGERNVLLEQIRNKSFNLKPATVSKPNIKGPPTNLKVAAILERANAIRQAFVGSDEDDDDDDDGDSWSDS